jgi:hypothetical protein
MLAIKSCVVIKDVSKLGYASNLVIATWYRAAPTKAIKTNITQRIKDHSTKPAIALS